MRQVFILFFAAAFLQCKNSVDKDLEKAWVQLKESSYKKGEQGRRFTFLFINHKDIPRDFHSRSIGWVQRLRASGSEEWGLDSLHFHRLRIANDSVDYYMPRFFDVILKSRDSISRPMYLEFQQDYLAAAKVVDSVKAYFNQASKKAGSPYRFD